MDNTPTPHVHAPGWTDNSLVGVQLFIHVQGKRNCHTTGGCRRMKSAAICSRLRSTVPKDPHGHTWTLKQAKQTNKNLRCGNRKGLLGRNDQTHHRMGPKTMESIPPSKRNTQADIQLRTRQTNHQQETDGCIQIKHNPEHQPSRMSSKSTAYVPPKTASTPTKANTQTCSYLDFNQFLIRRITRNICLRLRIKQIQILTCREQDIR